MNILNKIKNREKRIIRKFIKHNLHKKFYIICEDLINKISEKNFISKKYKMKVKCKRCKGIDFINYNKMNQKTSCKICKTRITFDEFNKKNSNNKLKILVDEKWWNENYKNHSTYLSVKCKKCDYKFESQTRNIIASYGCPICANNVKQDFWDFVKKIPEYSKLNLDINPGWWKVHYKNENTLINMHCKEHGEYQLTARQIKNGIKCPKCSFSKYEYTFYLILKENNIQFQYNYPIKYKNQYYYFDFYIEEDNLLIEIDGEQHFKPIDFAGKGEQWALDHFRKTKKNDFIKNKIAFIEHKKLLRIPYWEFNNSIKDNQ